MPASPACLEVGRTPPDHGGVQHKGIASWLAQGFPVQLVERWRADNVKVEGLQAALRGGLVSGIEVRMALEHLREQRLTIGDNTLGRLAGAHLVGEGEAQMFFEVPPETLFFHVAKRVGDGDRLGCPVVKAHRGVRLVSEAARFVIVIRLITLAF